MNLQQAQQWFQNYRQGNESAEETFARLEQTSNSHSWHSTNEEAIALIRSHRVSSSASESRDVRSLLQQFAFTKNPATSESATDVPTEGEKSSPDEKRSRGRAGESKDAREKRLNRERVQRFRSKRTAEASERERQRKVAGMTERRAAEIPSQRSQRLETDAVSHSQRRAAETPEERSQRRETDAVSHSQRRAAETPEERSQRRETDAASHSQHREAVVIANRSEAQTLALRANLDENVVVPHYCGPMNVRCQFCGSYNFLDERPPDGKFTKCCQKGKLLIAKPIINNVAQEYPEFLRHLLSDPTHPDYRNFRDHIRSYNSSVSFASFGATLAEVPGNGPYVFKVQGQTYHLSSHTEPRNENECRAYAQLYVLDSVTQAVQTRMQHPAMSDCDSQIIRQIHDFFRVNNSIARSYQLMHEIQEREAALARAQNQEVPVVHMAMRTDRSADERRYNLPTSNEVAMIFVNEDGEPPFNRDIRIYPRNPNNPNQSLFRLNIRNSNLDPMVYAIMFPYGQPGWHPEFRCNGRHFTMLQFKSALMAIRDEFSPIMHAGKLTQQWIVDSYLQVEAHNLDYIRHNQGKLRSELYQGLADFVNTRAAEAGVTAGRPVILPSSFQGSPRNMRERLQDAMAIFGKFGVPDLFITFTANPHWPEVEENFRMGETASDRCDVINKVFKIKLGELVRDITRSGIFGKSVAHVYTIEFQKRGLPHAHILVVLQSECKFRTPEQIDAVVRAEIPDNMRNPILHRIVSQQMIHGPCGLRCKDDDGKCSKRFPKDFQETTEVNAAGTGYPAYRRRIGQHIIKNGHNFDNQHVVPYNPYLLLKYNAHINVEVCTSLKAVKYIYKYIYKGFDSANCKIGYVDGQRVFVHDEISNFINARYVSASEGHWRLSGYKMHDRSHGVITLPVHLAQQQTIYFKEGREAEAVAAARDGITKLTSWFTLNRNDVAARQFLYSEIPYHYVYRNNMWNKRILGGDKIIGRMYGVSPRDEERYCLRLLLLHIPGATGYEDLRIFNGVQYGSFKEAATARRLLSSDEEFDRFLTEAALSQMPYQLRQSFAYLCIYCHPANSKALFDKYIDDFILDFVNHNLNRNAAINIALHQIQLIFKEHGRLCDMFGLPTPIGTYTEASNYSQTTEREKADRLIPTLTFAQREAFDKIVQGIDNPASTKLFYLNGPGGSGKTYLYQTLISFLRGRGQIVNSYASTGIAATLLDDATTIHSGFGVPVNLDETTTSMVKPSSAIGKGLRAASLLILDEITMLNKFGLSVIHNLLRNEIMKNEKPFGDKALVISGDFRQTLPIVPNGNRAKIIDASITSSNLWQHFKHISLIQNMRSRGHAEHNAWLLKLGSGDTPRIPGLSENSVEIPRHMITGNDIIEQIFGQDIRTMSVDNLSTRIILAATNRVTLELNQKIMEQLDGDFVTYTSSDEIISDDDRTKDLFPVEFLNGLTPSGTPPHKLSLKIGAVVMLIRNLNRRKGLCNGTRMIVRGLYEHYMKCEIISANHRGDIVFLSRLDITPSEKTLPFKMKRRQFPVIPAFAITINKSQGQTFEIVGIFLDEPVFGHGQLYVALSRCKNPDNIKVFIKEGPRQGQLLQDGRYFTENVVYREVFLRSVIFSTKPHKIHENQ